MRAALGYARISEEHRAEARAALAALERAERWGAWMRVPLGARAARPEDVRWLTAAAAADCVEGAVSETWAAALVRPEIVAALDGAA